MKKISRFLFGVICAGLSVGMCAGQEETRPTGTAATNETKSIVQGRVVQEPGGQGIRKVKVTLTGGSNQRREGYEVTTDEAGQFKFEDLEPGVYVVQLERSGYAEDAKTNPGRTIKVIAGQDTKDLVFHMLVAGVITGKIVDADGDPLRNVDVAATAGQWGTTRRNVGRSGNAATNDLGEYRIAELPPGKYIVQATPPMNVAPPLGPKDKDTKNGRLIYVTTYFPGTLDQRQAAAVEVSAGGTATVNFGVQTGHTYRVSGTVMGLSARPLPPDNTSETAVVVMRQGVGQLLLIGNNGQSEEQNLGEDGKFEFPNVLPGTYRAHVIAFSGFFNGETPLIKMQTISTPIEVNGSDVVGLQLQVDRGGDVSGKFRVEGDEKIDWKELSVSLLKVPDEGEEENPEFGIIEQAGMAMVNEAGSFEIKDVPGGNCQLAVSAHSDRFNDYYTKSVLLGGREVADTGFAVSSSTVLDVVVSAKGAGIEGTVVDGDGKPVAGATVVTVPSSGKLGRPDAYQFGVSEENGHFQLRGLNPGGFLVFAFEEMPENFRSPEFAQKYERKGEKVELEEGAKKRVVPKIITGERP